MARFEMKASNRMLTSYAGLSLVGQCLDKSELDHWINRRLPSTGLIKTSDIVRSVVGLLTLGKPDFDAIDPFRKDRYFREALGVSKVPSSAWLRQRLNVMGSELREHTDEMTMRLLKDAHAPITSHAGYVRLDFDTFTLDNSGTKKEEVSRTYQGFDGYTPIAAYLGNEGWCIGLELRPGSQHSACETDYFLRRVFPRLEALVGEREPVLAVSDSGFDSVRLLFDHEVQREDWVLKGRCFDWIVKWNPRGFKKNAWIEQATQEGVIWQETRPGKREALFERRVERSWQGKHRMLRLVLRVIERTSDKRGQMLLTPEVEVEGWWTSLESDPAEVIKQYAYHGTHEQFHSEIKTDMDLERLPSGKFDTNDAIFHLGMFAYNCLRMLGQLGLAGEVSPVKHPARRRRIRTVLQEIMYRAAQFISKGRKLILDFGGLAGHMAAVFRHIQERLWVPGTS